MGESSVCASGGEEVNVNIRCSNGTKFSVQTTLQSTVGEFKAVLAQNCDVPAEQQRLIYKGRILKDDQTLLIYGLQADHTVHMVRGSAPSAAPNSAAPAASESTNSTTGVPPAPSSRSSGIADAGATFFPGVDLGALSGSGVSRLFGTGLPEFEQVQQQLTQNPNMMREIINSPAIQSLMNNPEIMRSLIMSNPQMREIIDRNPELAHILNDPGVLRQTLEAARNPELMREMMRNTDRAMSNIESSPEGFNMLRRMYENVQEPFLNATTMDASADVGSNPFAALLRNQDATQTREVSNSANTETEMASGTTVPNANPLPNPWSNSGGLGVPELERMGMPDSSAFGQLLQNPAMAQMMQSFLSNPQYLDQILNLNPQLRSVLDVNPQLREMMQNPEIVRELTSPETMQQMMAFQQQLSQLSRRQSTPGGVHTDQGRGIQNNMGLDMLMNMFGGLGAGSLTASNAPDVPPEELYSTQLSQLQEMGFFDTEENIRALRATSGNVHAAVERLLGNPGR
ncbi:ubiquitin domain-containing protein DSK2b-like isoform X3 [Primulina eburnea]|uniref:ubiquitin domain-containing protein DSK2b-like isoform X3 n=1 Tax=Primulina eburnea TaxID=1245227 RepID=UPI003C6C932B